MLIHMFIHMLIHMLLHIFICMSAVHTCVNVSIHQPLMWIHGMLVIPL